jgi:hypothetical protein
MVRFYLPGCVAGNELLREEFESLAGGHHHRGFSLVDEEPGSGAEEVEGAVS